MSEETYPVRLGDVVALGLAASPNGEITCPVGQVTEVHPQGVRLALLNWALGIFDRPILVSWDRVLEIRWACRTSPEKHGYASGAEVFDCDPLAAFQKRWTTPQL